VPSDTTDPVQTARRNTLRAAIIVLAALIALPFCVTDEYFQNVLILMLLYAALSQAWNLLGGYCGQVSLGQGFHFGVGAYVSTMLFTTAGISPWLGMIPGGVISALLALAIGWPCFRLRGHYYTLATVVIAQAGYLLFLNWSWIGGAMGILIPITDDSWADLQFQRTKLPYYFVCLALFAAVWLVTYIIGGSKIGYCWRAVKDNFAAAESLGVPIFRYKMVAAAFSGFFAAIGGSIYAQYVSFIDPDSVMGFQLSLLIALPAVLGGLGTLWGPLVGAVVLIPMSELTRTYVGGTGKGIDLILYGLLVMVVAAVWPQGLLGMLHKLFSRRPSPIMDAADAA
jgi:branched-chain amino acid transport system permease protein